MMCSQEDLHLVHYYTRHFHVLEEVELPQDLFSVVPPLPRVFLKFTFEHVALPRGVPSRRVIFEAKILPEERQTLPSWGTESPPSIFNASGAPNEELGGFIARNSPSIGPASAAETRTLQPLFPPRYPQGDLGLIYAGPAAVESGMVRFSEAIGEYLTKVSASCACVPSGEKRSFTNPNSNAVVRLSFFQLFQEYLSFTSCIDLRIATMIGKNCYEVRLSAFDDIASKLSLVEVAWSKTRSIILSAATASSPSLDYAGRWCPLIEEGVDGPRVRPAKYLDALGAAGDGDNDIDLLRQVGYNPAGIMLNITSHAIPVPGCGVDPEVIPVSGAGEENLASEGRLLN